MIYKYDSKSVQFASSRLRSWSLQSCRTSVQQAIAQATVKCSGPKQSSNDMFYTWFSGIFLLSDVPLRHMDIGNSGNFRHFLLLIYVGYGTPVIIELHAYCKELSSSVCNLHIEEDYSELFLYLAHATTFEHSQLLLVARIETFKCICQICNDPFLLTHHNNRAVPFYAPSRPFCTHF